MPALPPQVPWRRFLGVLRKLGYTPLKGKAGSARSFCNPSRSPQVVSFREPIPGKTCASAWCTNTFASFSSPPMSSSGCWKTARAGAQTTARAHPGRSCGNSVLPRRRLADSPDEIPFPAGMSSMHPRPPRGKSAVPTELPAHPVPDSGLDTVRLRCEAKRNIHLRLRR